MATQKTSQGRVRIGCASWSVMARHAALFGAGDSMLARYATRFDCVEINSSFYRPHQRKTYARWATEVPAGFRFSVKLPKLVTHDMRLQGVGATLDRFADEVGGLGSMLGGLLVQLPPSLALEPRPAAAFLAMLRRRFPKPRIAFEPRHASWFTPRAEELLLRHAVARVAADPAPVPAAAAPAADTGWRYWRMHGSPRMYYSSYDDEALDALAAAITVRGERWVLFDNTAHGHAVTDAARLQARLRD